MVLKILCLVFMHRDIHGEFYDLKELPYSGKFMKGFITKIFYLK